MAAVMFSNNHFIQITAIFSEVITVIISLFAFTNTTQYARESTDRLYLSPFVAPSLQTPVLYLFLKSFEPKTPKYWQQNGHISYYPDLQNSH